MRKKINISKANKKTQGIAKIGEKPTTTNPQKVKGKISAKLPKLSCPACGSDNFIRNGKTYNGEQKYLCKACSRTFCASRIKQKIKLSGIKCPHCNSNNIKLNGKTQNGIQRYICKNEECPAVTFQINYHKKGIVENCGITPPPEQKNFPNASTFYQTR
jgi:transposase-like protein